jgi:hypothetical protein
LRNIWVRAAYPVEEEEAYAQRAEDEVEAQTRRQVLVHERVVLLQARELDAGLPEADVFERLEDALVGLGVPVCLELGEDVVVLLGEFLFLGEPSLLRSRCCGEA